MEWGNEKLWCPGAGWAGYDCKHVMVGQAVLYYKCLSGRSRCKQKAS